MRKCWLNWKTELAVEPNCRLEGQGKGVRREGEGKGLGKAGLMCRADAGCALEHSGDLYCGRRYRVPGQMRPTVESCGFQKTNEEPS